MGRPFIDLTNKRCGRLVVLKRNGTRGHNILWKCICDCGKYVNILSGSIIRNYTKSCGCLKTDVLSKDLKGKIFGKLKILENIKNKRISSGLVWLCLCECGKKKKISSQCLIAGSSRSCGCSKIEFSRIKRIKPETAFNVLYKRYISDAKRRNLEFKINKIEFKDMTLKNCYYCDVNPSQRIQLESKSGTYIYNGLDRSDNEKGYTIDNCVPCCGLCNWMKINLSKDKFLDQIKKIHFNRNV